MKIDISQVPMDMATRDIQRHEILLYLMEHGSASARELSFHLGIGSPRKRLSELRRDPILAAYGYQLSTKKQRLTKRNGRTTEFNIYFLEVLEDV